MKKKKRKKERKKENEMKVDDKEDREVDDYNERFIEPTERMRDHPAD